MATVNTIISNSKTGQTIRFIQTAKSTNGQLLEMESTFSPHSKEPPIHYHPYQTEDFVVLKGEIKVRLDGQIRILKEGDHLHINPHQRHAMWNVSDSVAVVSWKVQPAMNTENLFEIITGLANDGKTNAVGQPNILQVALTINRFSNVFRLATPPFAIQRVVFYLLMPVAYLLGYKAVYKKYIDA